MSDPEAWALHDKEAHKRASVPNGPDGVRWPTCPRCAQLCIEFHHRHNIAHLLPAGYERGAAEPEAVLTIVEHAPADEDF